MSSIPKVTGSTHNERKTICRILHKLRHILDKDEVTCYEVADSLNEFVSSTGDLFDPVVLSGYYQDGYELHISDLKKIFKGPKEFDQFKMEFWRRRRRM